ncbi:MAG: 2-keto-4-pentenoate hydratase [Peptococcaceae bacterium]|nr:2-keto-4-pentenoate hydratase [Peptococcaceae bacterium]
MTREEILQDMARRLSEAGRTRRGMAALTDEAADLTIEEAYRIQLMAVRSKAGPANRVAGKKIGLTSRAMQDLLGVFEPDYGHLFSDMEVDNGGVISLSALIQPKVEAEVAFLLNRDLTGPGVSVSAVLRATDAVIPSLEIVDSRIRDWKIKIQDTVADNASSARFVLGGRLTRVADLDLSLTGLVFKKNGAILGTAAGAAVAGHPAAAVAWLANKLAAFEIGLKAGEVVLSGAFLAAVPPAAGDFFEACFDRLGTVGVRFAG